MTRLRIEVVDVLQGEPLDLGFLRVVDVLKSEVTASVDAKLRAHLTLLVEETK